MNKKPIQLQFDFAKKTERKISGRTDAEARQREIMLNYYRSEIKKKKEAGKKNG